MDAPGYEPTSWLGVVPWLLYAAPLILLAFVTVRGQWKARRHNVEQAATNDELKKTMGTIRNNVQNGHPTLMREDIDKLIEGIKELRDEQKEQGETLVRVDRRLDRVEERLDRVDCNLSIERQERIAGDRRA
ncbi:hypothetical protein SEA_YEET_49 [Mycobacterium phage Yeet]|uniref:Uncharacterized protein n=3 Tax=Omegavirus TaxID=1623292 RepID=A0A3S9UAT1_9CAUD|nr:hypothetical protein N857_gp057 [Mycobacterium phage Wanda]YP_009124010.1 hypothetical protein VC71_gp057 [Mycobacterium phage Minerva]YP_009590912.1 hypothetical protein FDG54_gp056 [Mycobacterium phage Optimus]YP_009636226.1 hypothetical protein FGG20_gp055 [Mycobacterium phage Baka]AWH13863.1 hypothetical protein SEA_HALLEY_51 [Mycobacterium phage Halley]AXQ52054.1 hypothetical protein SEA_EJIMIX_51 [Mycobacterium phage Ejimix]AXQ52287.1 hypothetical protein SEA_ERICMILLARD_51 [Mycobact